MESFRGQSLETIVRRTRVPMVVGESRVAARRLSAFVRRVAPPAPGEHLRLAVDVTTYPPTTRAGSERSLDAVLQWLGRRGHDVRVLVPPDQASGPYGAVEVVTTRDEADRRQHYAWSNLVGTQLEAHNRVARFARAERRPLVHFLRLGYFNRLTTYGKPDLLVYNADWIRTKFPWRGRSIVVHSPIYPEEFRTTPGTAMTIINLSAKKGGRILPLLANRLPDHHFLAVVGSWGEQLVPDPLPRNVTIIENTPDIRSVYARTRVLLHPSGQEAHPRIGLEAAASGIPTIARPLPGTREALGDAAIYVDFDDIDGWIDAICRLDDSAEYALWSARALKRSADKDPHDELEALERALLAIVA